MEYTPGVAGEENQVVYYWKSVLLVCLHAPYLPAGDDGLIYTRLRLTHALLPGQSYLPPQYVRVVN
jgi:hypothetical protein